MSREGGPSEEEMGVKSTESSHGEDRELTLEDEQFVEANPELGQVSMLEGAKTLIAEGQKFKDSSMIEQGLEIIDAVEDSIVTSSDEDPPRANTLKRVLREIGNDFFKEHTGKQPLEDMRTFASTVKNASDGDRLKTILRASVDLSRKQGILHLIEDIRRGVKK